MMIENWVLILTVVFITVTKFLQYSSKYHESWVNQFSLRNTATYKTYRAKLHEQVTLQEANNSISAQDNYAKWTKNNRKADALGAELKELKAQLHSQNSQANKSLKNVKLIGLTLPFLALKLWKGKEIVYYLPSNKIFPHILNGICNQGWLFVAMYPLSFILHRVNQIHDVTFISSKIPVYSGELVGVSLGIWVWALTSVLSTIEFLVNELVIKEAVPKPEEKKETKTTIEISN